MLGWEIAENVDVELIGGVFPPGAADPGARANAYVVGTEVDYRFRAMGRVEI